MQRLMHLILGAGGLILAWVGLTLAWPAVVHAQWETAASSNPSADPAQSFDLVPVGDTFRGVTVFSERELGGEGPGSDRYFLTRLVDGRPQRVAIAPRVGVPFDVDLGPDGDGGLVAAYSRCDSEPDLITVRDTFGARVFSRPYPAYTAGRGCDIYRYDFATQRESRLEGASTGQASEMLPSIWKDEVAFARVYEQREDKRGVYPYLYVRPLDGGRSDRQPGGSRGTNGLPGPTRLDLYGRRLSFVWNYSTREAQQGGLAGTTELRLDTVGGANRVLGQARHGNERPYASYLGPQGDRGRIFYGYQRAELDEGVDRSVASLLLSYRITTGDRALNDTVPRFLIDTSTDGGTNVIATDDNNFGFSSNAGRIQANSSVDYDD
jgi:hypothetical protein